MFQAMLPCHLHRLHSKLILLLYLENKINNYYKKGIITVTTKRIKR